ncbi:MAG: amino acid racemase [Desulfobacteraceae bacterium]|nr:MAG: amino acid racemase [Desulfobacteraceae bacterium]
MKKIGMIGGLAWPSTVEYYRGLCTKTNEHYKANGVLAPYPTPHIIIESLNINETRKLRGIEGDEASWERFERVFRETFLRLRKAGADIGAIASNTPHMRLSRITRGLDFPVVSILDATAEAVRALGGKRALILGTSVTMGSPAYTDTLRKYGLDVLPRLDEKQTAELDRLIDIDLFQGKIAGAHSRILNLCREPIEDGANDVVCLACTELPLAFPEHKDAACFKVDGIWFINTTVVHIDAILREALA